MLYCTCQQKGDGHSIIAIYCTNDHKTENSVLVEASKLDFIYFDTH